MILCPKCKDAGKAFSLEDTYYYCVYCGISGDSKNLKIEDIDWNTPKGYKPETFFSSGIQEVQRKKSLDVARRLTPNE
jgi:hypothetical protein